MSKQNPFHSLQAKKYSCYIRPETINELSPSEEQPGVTDRKTAVIHRLNDFIQADTYPCLAAKASFNTAVYRAGIYPALADEQATEGLSYDLYRFIQEKEAMESNFTSFLAVFDSPLPESELEFEQLLWQQLRLLDKKSRQLFSWNKEVSSNPEDADFSFSFAGQAFFVVGMHPKASRMSRRFSSPMLVFNPHEQFEQLKENGLYDGMKSQIRKRDEALQGSLNPVLEDFGTASEARQYAGRHVSENWKCPFNTK